MVVEPGLDPAAPGARSRSAPRPPGSPARCRPGCAASPGRPSRPRPSRRSPTPSPSSRRRYGPRRSSSLDTDAGRQLAPMVAHRCGGGAVVGCSDVTVVEPPDDGRRAGSTGARCRSASPSTAAGCSGRSAPRTARVPVVTLDLAGIETPAPDADGARRSAAARPRRRRRTRRSATSRRSRPTRAPWTWSTRGGSSRPASGAAGDELLAPCASSPTSSRAPSARRGR